MKSYPTTPKFPTAIWIEPTNICNLRCRFCFQINDSMTRKKGSMDFLLFEKIIDEIEAFHPTLVLHHSGESFLHRDFFRMIRLARGRDLEVRLTTNGTLLSRDNFEILKSGLNSLNISLAGVDNEEYRKMRLEGGFEEIKRGILHLAAEKVKLGIDMELTLNVIRTGYNRDKVAGFKKQFDSIEGIDKVILRNLIDWSSRVDVNEIRPASDVFRAAANGIKKGLRGIERRMSRRRGMCRAVYESAAILWDGTVVPCCFDFNGTLALGNINEKAFGEIWNGEPMARLRTVLRSGKSARKHPVCGPCIFK